MDLGKKIKRSKTTNKLTIRIRVKKWKRFLKTVVGINSEFLASKQLLNYTNN